MRLKLSLFAIVFVMGVGSALCGLTGCTGQNLTAENAPQAQTVDQEAELLRKSSGFDADRAFEHVRKLVDLGPHPAGSAANKDARSYIMDQLQQSKLKVTTDTFIAATPSPKFPTIEMTNIIGELPGQKDDILIVASHYDSKYFDNLRFVGANDSGSSTGTLLEIARVLAATKPSERKIAQTLWFVFFDGEEAVVNWSGNDHTYGSRHMVESLRASGKLSKVKGMILLDMIGDKDLVIPREAESTEWMAKIITKTGQKLGYETNFPDAVQYIEDDHIPFLQAGVKAVDLIDFTYGSNNTNYGLGGPTNAYWHTAEDTLDKLSPKSLKIVGDTVLKSLPKIAAQAY